MEQHRLGVTAAVVDGVLVPGEVVLRGDRIAAVGEPIGPNARGVAVAGFVDLQVNGFAGVSFGDTDRAGYEAAGRAMAACGVTSYLVTIPTAPPEQYERALGMAAAVIADPPPGARPIGVHLEGPFLSPLRPGAHRPDWLRSPDVELARRLCSLAPVTVMTVAPELPGAAELIAALVELRVVVSAGHTDATGAQARAAFASGVSMVTHLWNAQRQVTSREPGLCGVALVEPDVHVGVIADAIHVSRETLQITIAAAGARAFVVSDAVSLAGLPEGRYRALGSAGTLPDGAVRLDDGTLAGSAAGMDVALRTLMEIGLPLEVAVAAMTTSPAAAIRRGDLGTLAVGGRADVVVLDPATGGSIDRVYVAGTLNTSG